VGVNLVVFTVVNALWLKPLPFRDADRLVTITQPFFVLEAPALKAFEAVTGQVITSESEAGLRPILVFDRVGRDVETLGVTSEYFRLFGLAIRGRDFTPDDDRVGAEPVAIISDRLWSREFGRRSEAIGAVAAARPFPIRIIGVAPPDFEGARRGEKADVWIPCNLVPRVAPAAQASSVLLMVFARLYRGQTPTEVARRLVETGLDPGLAVVRLKDVFGTPESRTIIISERGALSVVAGLASLVLLGGCATLMALVLVHYERRRGELAVRIALGASRRRLTSELSRELGILAVGGTIGAVLVAVWGLRTIPSLTLPGGVDLGRLDLSIDWRVLTAAVAATVLTLVAGAVLPVSRFTRASLAGELLAGPATTASASSQRIRQTLLALHVCATIVVLVAAGLFVRAVIHGFGNGPGFDAGRTVFVTVQIMSPLRDPGPPDVWRAAVTERTTRLWDALRSLPGVDNVAAGMPPIGPEQASYLVVPSVVETRRERRVLLLGTMFGSPELLPTLGIPILAGRGLSAADATTKPTPAIVTASLARMLWPAENPLGHVLSFGAGRGHNTCLVVGIARDFIFGSFARPAAGVVVTARQGGFGIEPEFAIHAAHTGTLAEPIRKVVKRAMPDAPWLRAATGHDIVARDLGRQRLGAWFFSGFGLTALILGVGGVFGLVAYLAESRRREFGVRLALGATPGDLVWRGLAAALVPVSLGVAAGLFLAALVARLFTSWLAGLGALDPLTYAAVAITMLGCAALASLGAAWRLRLMTSADALRTN
jgi:predicted permease